MTDPHQGREGGENLFAALQARAGEQSGRVFLHLPDGATLTYADVFRRSAQLANRLAERGVVEGDRVAVQIEKSATAVCLYLACLRAGAVFLPLNPAYKRGELAYFLEDAEPRLVVVGPDGAEEMRALAAAHPGMVVDTLDNAGQGSLVEGLGVLPTAAQIAERSADDLACILYTSGTTGRPKGAMLSHGNLWANALALEEAWGWRPDDVLIHALPIFHVHGLFVALHCAMLGASRMHFLPRFDADQIIERLADATVLMGVPTFYTRLLEHPGLTAEACRGMRLFVSGSAPLLEETFHRWKERTGHAILERYGMTETNMNTSNPLHGVRIPGTVGVPLPGVDVRIVNAEGTCVADGEIGSLQVKGPNVFSGYWRLPEKTREEFSAGYFITGDLASRDPETGYLSIVGRAKDLVITGGYNVYPKEVESVIDDLPGVLESAVIGVPDADFGEAVVAVVVPDGDGPGLTPDALITALKQELASFKVPRTMHIVDALPRNAMGKVQKNVLREQYGG